MNFNRSKKHMILIAIASAGLLFAGCQKKVEVAAEEKPVEVQEVQPVVETVEKPSTNSVYFAFDKSDLDAAARATLDANAAWLNANGDVNATIEGNCDERGSREYNLALGQRRADSVRDFLISRGVSGDRLDTVSFGEERPVCQDSGEACWAQNRRGDIVTR
ncbi:peptidoglycan-associated lipoprotein [Mariprofundus ferrinatatus]|uniref:Peptidoglycan-associated lipoprotein n=1 Tax=Mariprofundus ferrinatatus TaxID=1921087 RepID=A0A2K8L6L1_9PROT|nr:peptidoglycan-associated lipoprotein Pal [Mariprofundus ferrinatatus]ATX81889.1 peptidoglycan-associated lipoprotein [Mariprofundus ferrinatatus]